MNLLILDKKFSLVYYNDYHITMLEGVTMAIWGEVSYKVKRAITFHKRFSVAELVDATDLSYGQVEQVVQRLIKQDYVRSLEDHELNPAEQALARRVGRPRKRYTLTEEPVKQEEFYAGVEAIASAERLSRAKERKPSTPYFNRAMQMIEAMERGAEPLSATRLEEATSFLAYGRDFESLIPEGAEIVQAHYDFAQARLEVLLKNYSKAEELLAQVEEAFRTAGLDEQVQKSIDLRFAFKVTQGFAEITDSIEQQADPWPALEALKRFICDFPSPSHFLLPLQQAIEAIGTAFEASLWLVTRWMPTIITTSNGNIGRWSEDLSAYICSKEKSIQKALELAPEKTRLAHLALYHCLSHEDAVDSVRINDLVKTCLERRLKHAPYQFVRPCLDLQEDLDSIATVRASRDWLQRALEILVDNAVQAMLEADSPEKRLTVTTQRVGRVVKISVTDTGPGIPRDLLKKLFKEPIYRPVRRGGTGIGLTLAQTIVETYGGDIRVESTTGDERTNTIIVLPIES
jgi:signal transduction histidine kinase